MTLSCTSSAADTRVVAFALSGSATIRARQYRLTDADCRTLDHVLLGLVDLGHVAAYALLRTGARGSIADALSDIRGDVGTVVADAVIAAGALAHPADLPHPDALVAVWDFSEDAEGRLVAAASFCGLDLLVRAEPCGDEDGGVTLPGHDGRWLIFAEPATP